LPKDFNFAVSKLSMRLKLNPHPTLVLLKPPELKHQYPIYHKQCINQHHFYNNSLHIRI